MTTNGEPLSTKDTIAYIVIGIALGIIYVGALMIISNVIDINETNSIIPEAHAQIQPFEQQLAQIRDPAECTRKVVRGASAQTPFLIKVFYDTTADRTLSFKQQGTSFPVTQTTNQVMTFFTSEVDQYEIHMEMNYRIPKERQIYIEYLTGGSIVQSEQEKFDGTKFCMTLFANTILPPAIPTKEEIFGQSLEFVNQIPLMIDSFNRNTYTQSTTIAYMWMLILGVLFFSVITFISVQVGNRKFKLKMRDVDDIVTTGSTLVTSMDSMINSVSKPLQEVSKDLKKILDLPQVKEKLEQVKEPKESKARAIIKKMIPIKKKEDYQVTIGDSKCRQQE